MAFPKITHVIFDMDGLLIDTERLYTIIMDKVCEEHGKKFTWEIKQKQMGRKEQESARVLIEELDLPITVEQYIEKVHALQAVIFPQVGLLPGAEKLVRHLHKHKIPICIATGSNKYGYNLKTQNHKSLFELFSHVVLSSEDPEVKQGKPAPDCFLVAAKRFQGPTPDPTQCLVFEDAPNGAEAAIAAGMPCVWIPDERADTSILASKVALHITTLLDFKPEDFGLPPYDS